MELVTNLAKANATLANVNIFLQKRIKFINFYIGMYLKQQQKAEFYPYPNSDGSTILDNNERNGVVSIPPSIVSDEA